MEIERKFLINPNDLNRLIFELQNECPDSISDYYFNDYTRLRKINNDYFITVKSIGTIERQEYEYALKEVPIIPGRMLSKVRYYYPYKGHKFEINFYNLYYHTPFSNDKLILVEVELKDKDEHVELPDWIGMEVTEDPRFYNRNIFKSFQESLV